MDTFPDNLALENCHTDSKNISINFCYLFMCNGTIEERRLLTCMWYLPTKEYMVVGSCLGWPNSFLSLHTHLALMEILGVMWIFCNFIPSPETIKNLLFAQHLSKLAENGSWIFNYSWAIGTSNVDHNMAPTTTNDDKYATKDEKTGMDNCHHALEGFF